MATIAGARLEDLPKIQSIDQELFNKEAWPLEEFQKWDLQHIIVAKVENEIVGSLLYKLKLIDTYQYINISNLVIKKLYQHQGIGTQLIEYMLHLGNHFCLHVEIDNEKAIKCYKKCGFQITKMESDYYGKDKPAYLMTLIK